MKREIKWLHRLARRDLSYFADDPSGLENWGSDLGFRGEIR